MSRRSFGLIVRLLAVGAAIYAFYTLKHVQQPAPKGGPITVKVIPAEEIVCGWIKAEKKNAESTGTVPDDPLIVRAVASPGKAIEVRGEKDCQHAATLNGKIAGPFQLIFVSTPR